MRRADVDIRQQRRTRTIQKCILTCSSGARDARERENHATDSHSTWKTYAASVTLDRDPNDRALVICGSRIRHRRLWNIRGACPGKAIYIASIRHNSNVSGQHQAWAAESASTFNQAARFRHEHRGVQRAAEPVEPGSPVASNSRHVSYECSDRQRTLCVLLSWPAPLRKDQSSCVGGAAKLACQFERLVAFRTWGHQACKLQGVRCEVVPIKPVSMLIAPQSSRCLGSKSFDTRL